jgi:hypothetical protein
LLSKSIPTLTEPDWQNKALSMDDVSEIIKFTNDHHQEDTLVKYTSRLCEIMPSISGKKVFLYRNFEDHLRKLSEQNNFNVKEQAIRWAYMFFNAASANDVLYMQTDYFLKNRQEAVKLVCTHFGIEYIPVDLPDDFDAKKNGYNHTNKPIKL